ncbi:very short patch repair endonuclease [Hymenobacter sp. BRD67]|uniref:very short patch repair endonuclease n=1 Tax=Hymenobacter sp. BRD67 TaxID=2675877 RepID=UPI0020B7AD72|nr:very short patch repair endonuclease [Hymenobacter sp. BRD67]
MARVKSKDTTPELAVRRALFAAGLRYRLNAKQLPGSPDIILPSRRIAIFVHGCFWHRHPDCKRATFPSSNVLYWQGKFDRNVARDAEAKEAIQNLGWQHITIWECDIRTPAKLAELVDRVKASAVLQ